MRKGLLEFARRARGSEIAIVFYAGHGMEVGGENYLIPIDAELKADVDVDHEAIALKTMTPLVENASRLGLVILDACRNNPFSAKMQRTVRTRAVSRGLAAVEPTGNVLIAFSAREGTTAADGAGRNSPFTASLLNISKRRGSRSTSCSAMCATTCSRRPSASNCRSSMARFRSEAIYLKAALPVPLRQWRKVRTRTRRCGIWCEIPATLRRSNVSSRNFRSVRAARRCGTAACGVEGRRQPRRGRKVGRRYSLKNGRAHRANRTCAFACSSN